MRSVLRYCEREVEFVDEVFSGKFTFAFRRYVHKVDAFYQKKDEWSKSETPTATEYYQWGERSGFPFILEELQDREMYIREKKRFDAEFVVFVRVLLACVDKGYREHVRKLGSIVSSEGSCLFVSALQENI